MTSKSEIVEEQLSRRERQVMDVLLAHGRATVAEIRARMEHPASYSAVRAVLRVLKEKSLLSHEYDGPRYIYRPTVSKQQARSAVLKRTLDLFFEGSAEQLVTALFEVPDLKTTSKELKRIGRLLEKVREDLR